MIGKLLAVVHRLHPGVQGQELDFNGQAHKISRLVEHPASPAADGAAASAQQSGDLADGLLGFQDAVNLVSFFSA